MQRIAAEPAGSVFSLVVLSGLVRAVEWAAILIAGLAPYYAYVTRQVGSQPVYLFVIALIASGAILTFQTLHAYTLPAFRRPVRAMARIGGGWIAVFLVVFAVMFFLRTDQYLSRVWMASVFALGLALIAAERLILAAIVARMTKAGRLQRRAVVVGGGELGGELLHDLASADPAEIRVIGVFDDRGDARSPDQVEGYPKLGTVDDLVEFARSTRIDLVIFALPITAEQRILQMLRKLWVLPIDIRLAAHANRLQISSALLFLCRRGARPRHSRQADRRLGRRHQAGRSTKWSERSR